MERFEFYGAPDMDREMTEAFAIKRAELPRKLKKVDGKEKPEKKLPGKPGLSKLHARGKRIMMSVGSDQGDFWGDQIDQALQERMTGVERQHLLYRLRKKQRGKDEKDEKDEKGKKKPSKYKAESWDDLEREIAFLESTTSAFPEVRERRIREAKADLKKVLESA